jgi:hypothetical protein
MEDFHLDLPVNAERKRMTYEDIQHLKRHMDALAESSIRSSQFIEIWVNRINSILWPFPIVIYRSDDVLRIPFKSYCLVCRLRKKDFRKRNLSKPVVVYPETKRNNLLNLNK